MLITDDRFLCNRDQSLRDWASGASDIRCALTPAFRGKKNFENRLRFGKVRAKNVENVEFFSEMSGFGRKMGVEGVVGVVGWI